MEQTVSRQSRAGLGRAPRVAKLLPQAFEALSAMARDDLFLYYCARHVTSWRSRYWRTGSRDVFIQDPPDGSRTGVNIRPFPGFVQTVARGGRRPTPGSPNGGRGGLIWPISRHLGARLPSLLLNA